VQIAVIGSGYVGLVAAACFAELGHKVVCVDNNVERIAALKAGEILIHEEFLPEVLGRNRGRRLTFSCDSAEAIRTAPAIVIAVGTPQGADGQADLSYVESVAHEIAQRSNGYKLIVEKSTVPVYTNAWIQTLMVQNGCGIQDFDVVSNPEFLREGTAVTDFLYPDRIVVGADSDRAKKLMREIYAPLLNGSYARESGAVPGPDNAGEMEYLETSTQSAELIKHASNAFLAMKISFINMVANLSESVGADIEEVRRGIGSDKRIGQKFLRAGIGYGGSCFPKDVAAFQSVARACGTRWNLLEEVSRINQEQIGRFLQKVRKAVGPLKGKRLAVLGLAFKGGTDDIRESPAINVIQGLLAEGYKITCFDPAAMGKAKEVLGQTVTYARDAYAAADNADALLILTEWKEFADLDLKRIRRLLAVPLVLDGRNLYSPETMSRVGITYHSVGRSTEKIRSLDFAMEDGSLQLRPISGD
jgi:UDPglucose 6-dehydrogenase